MLVLLSMEYVGALDNRISRFTLGTVQLGKQYGIANISGQPSREEAVQILHYAFREGVNVIDTAHNYGDSEKIIGEALDRYERKESIFVVTKLNPFKIGSSGGGAVIRKNVEESLRSSLAHLRLDFVHFYLLHDPVHMNNEKIMDMLLSLRDSGLIKNIGVSIYSPEEADLALSVEGINTVQVPFSIFDQRLISSGFLNKAKSRKRIVFARSIFLQGLLLMDSVAVPKHLKEVLPLKRELAGICEDAGRPLKEVALKFALAQKGISSLVVGVDNVGHLKEDLACFEGPPLDNGTINRLKSLFKEVPEYIINPALWNKPRG
jgi:aryl-alcohol dehydrogenase-like predicted oxidoreductase